MTWCREPAPQVSHLLDSATSEWSAITGDLAAALPESQPAAETTQAENVPPATEPLRERCGGGPGPAGGCGVQGASGGQPARCVETAIQASES